MSVVITRTIDLSGLSCPLPIVRTAQALKEMRSGEVIEVLATDPGSVADFAAWARATRNTLLESHHSDATYRFVIQKR